MSAILKKRRLLVMNVTQFFAANFLHISFGAFVQREHIL